MDSITEVTKVYRIKAIVGIIIVIRLIQSIERPMDHHPHESTNKEVLRWESTRRDQTTAESLLFHVLTTTKETSLIETTEPA